MRTPSKTAARDTVAPTLHKAQETFTDSVLPTVRDAFATAREKGIDFLDSDIALEARRRGIAVVKAAKGDTTVTTPKKRWKLGFGMLIAGSGLGYAIAWAAKRLATPVESYTHTMPVPSGTDGGTTTTDTTGATGTMGARRTTPTTSATPATGSDENIDLRSGAPTTL